MSVRRSPHAGSSITYPQLRALVETQIDRHASIAAYQSCEPESDLNRSVVCEEKAQAVVDLLFQAGVACGYAGDMMEDLADLRSTILRRFDVVHSIHRNRVVGIDIPDSLT